MAGRADAAAARVRDGLRPVRAAGLRASRGRLRAQAGAARTPGADGGAPARTPGRLRAEGLRRRR